MPKQQLPEIPVRFFRTASGLTRRIADARKVEYTAPEGTAFQRVEFISQRREDKDWRISLQMPKDSTDLKDLENGNEQACTEEAPDHPRANES